MTEKKRRELVDQVLWMFGKELVADDKRKLVEYIIDDAAIVGRDEGYLAGERKGYNDGIDKAIAMAKAS